MQSTTEKPLVRERPGPIRNPVPNEPRPLRYRIVHVLYVGALLASSIGTFGPGGLLPFIAVCGFWGIVFFFSPTRPQGLATALGIVLALSCLVSLLLPAVRSAREAARRMSCGNNLKQISLALHNYHDVYGSFPPAYVCDASGRPAHSWRVLVLPFIESSPLYDNYSFSEPWDGPNNIKLLASMPRVYECPSRTDAKEHPNCTSYVAVVDPSTAWPGATPAKIAAITDGTSNTLLVVESHSDIPWTQPTDLSLAQALNMLSDTEGHHDAHRAEDFFYRYAGRRTVAMADGSVNYLPDGIAPNTWSALLKVADGTDLTEADLEASVLVAKQPKYGNWIRLGVFALLAVFPLPWVWINPTPTRKA